MNGKPVEIEIETTAGVWRATLSPAEYEAWDKYCDTHAHLLNDSYEATLRMFLGYFRQGIDLNHTRTLINR